MTTCLPVYVDSDEVWNEFRVSGSLHLSLSLMSQRNLSGSNPVSSCRVSGKELLSRDGRNVL